MPDWIIVLIVLLIIAIVLDGLRRVRQHRKENIRLSKRAHLADQEVEGLDGESLDEHASEFPSGGARKSQQAFATHLHNAEADTQQRDSVQVSTPYVDHDDKSQNDHSHNTLTFDEPVPMLMESVVQEEQLDLELDRDLDLDDDLGDHLDQNSTPNLAANLDSNIGERLNPSLNPSLNTDTFHTTQEISSEVEANKAKKAAAQSSLGILANAPGEQKEALLSQDFVDTDNNQHTDASTKTHTSQVDMQHGEPTLGSLDDLDGIDEAPMVAPNTVTHRTEKSISADGPKDNPLNFKNYKPKLPKRTKEKPKPKPPENEPQEVVIVNVMAKNGTFFEGQQLLQAFVDNNLKFGDRDIFHRHVKVNGDGAVLFSVANMVVPGTFDLVSIDSFVTPGVSMFMTLPVDEESLVAFNIMIDTAKSLASSLEGELKDENRSVMTAQTIEHAKEKVLEYERKRQLRHR